MTDEDRDHKADDDFLKNRQELLDDDQGVDFVSDCLKEAIEDTQRTRRRLNETLRKLGPDT